MTDHEQEPLFSETPDREHHPGETSSWKDKALQEDRLKLHQGQGDKFDRKDAQAQETMGRTRLETGGMSRRQANNLLNVHAARGILDASSRERAAAEAKEKSERERIRDAEIIELLRDKPTDEPPPTAA